MKKFIKQCDCGSKEFFVTESMLWSADLEGDDFVLQCCHADGEISSIMCKKCEKEYDSLEFKEINFN